MALLMGSWHTQSFVSHLGSVPCNVRCLLFPTRSNQGCQGFINRGWNCKTLLLESDRRDNLHRVHAVPRALHCGKLPQNDPKAVYVTSAQNVSRQFHVVEGCFSMERFLLLSGGFVSQYFWCHPLWLQGER